MRAQTNPKTSLSRRGVFQRYKYMYLMLIPGLLYIIIFHYLPMAGLAIAFEKFSVVKGVFHSPFAGLDNFQYLFSSLQFRNALKNTFIISFYKILFGFPSAILLALLINEVRQKRLQKLVQTVVYLPHFLSWIVMYGLIFNLLRQSGPVDSLITSLGGQTINFMSDTDYFRGVVVISDLWKEMGWNAIIYLAALAGVPQELYEAAQIDGASRFKCLWKISLPCIMPTITVMFLLRIGSILNAGFDQILALYNSAVFSVGDIIDTYVFRLGIQEAKFDVATAAGLFKSVFAFLLVFGTNKLMSRFDQETLF